MNESKANNHLVVKELPICERPYEKAVNFGIETLSDVELLAIIIKTGTSSRNSMELSREILRMPDGCYSLLSICHKTIEELTNIAGIGTVKALTLKCVAEISKRISVSDYGFNFKIESASVISKYYMEKIRHENREHVIAVYLNGSNYFIMDKVISVGTVNKALVDLRQIFIHAFQCQAVYVILIHNHPSGDPTPSKDDIQLTENAIKAGKLVGVEVLDHLIIGDNKYLSFKERGLI